MKCPSAKAVCTPRSITILFVLLTHGSAVHVVRWSILQFLLIELVIITCSSVELSTFQDIKPGANAPGFSFANYPAVLRLKP